MDYVKFYEGNKTFIVKSNDRLRKIVRLADSVHPTAILDIGCGQGTLLDILAKNKSYKLYGVDVYKQKSKKWNYKISDVTKRIDFPKNSFDLIIMGEIIEHVPDPDHLLNEAYRMLKPGGYIIVTTPNLASWLNRLLLLLGIQPIFTETSTKQNLGRVFKKLGQGGKVQGHLKIFTHRSLSEIIVLNRFALVKKTATQFVNIFPASVIDKILSNYVPLASDLIYLAQKPDK